MWWSRYKRAAGSFLQFELTSRRRSKKSTYQMDQSAEDQLAQFAAPYRHKATGVVVLLLHGERTTAAAYGQARTLDAIPPEHQAGLKRLGIEERRQRDRSSMLTLITKAARRPDAVLSNEMRVPVSASYRANLQTSANSATRMSLLTQARERPSTAVMSAKRDLGCVRIPIEATARVPINRSDTYWRFPTLASDLSATGSRSIQNVDECHLEHLKVLRMSGQLR